MTQENILLLIEKYFAGETSIEEEKSLKQYFSQAEIATELMRYKSLFIFLKEEKKIEMARPIALPKAIPHLQSRQWVWNVAAAAVALLIVSVLSFKYLQKVDNQQVMAHKNPNYIVLDEGDDPQKAFEQAQAALMLVSKKMRKGERAATQGLMKVKSATDDAEQVLDLN
jgi:uncharacterized pyridoxal phosphate-containing UPF0001 family protein